MARWRRVVLCMVLVAAAFGREAAVLCAQDASVAGQWTGSIALPPGPLNISVSLARDPAGVWTGAIDIPAQGAKALALGSITVDGPAVSFRILGVPGNPTFVGRASDDNSTVSGTFTQGGAGLPFELRRGAAKPASRPQEPKPPFPYAAEDVRYRNEPAGIELAGTLTLPRATNPAPAVLLITGSGAQDRDETILGHKPFLVLADHLTRAGIAVLRVDDRGVGGSGRGRGPATAEDFAGDVRAGVAYLKGRADIDSRRIGLIGHSEGANIAAMVASSSSDIKFIVMMAGTGLPGDDILLAQATALARTHGAGDAAIAWDRSIRERVYALVKSERDGNADAARRQSLLADLPPPPGATDTAPARMLATTLLNAASSPWFRFFLSYDPRQALSRVTCPVLAIGGELDMQVPARENLGAIGAALEAAGNRDATVTSLPRLNHLFQTSTTGAPSEYAVIEETIAPSVLTLIADWVRSHVS